jgi:hypothetical protein
MGSRDEGKNYCMGCEKQPEDMSKDLSKKLSI